MLKGLHSRKFCVLKMKGLSFGGMCLLGVHALQAPDNRRVGCLPWAVSFFKENQTIAREIYWLINRTFPGLQSCAQTLNLLNYFHHVVLKQPLASQGDPIVFHQYFPCRRSGVTPGSHHNSKNRRGSGCLWGGRASNNSPAINAVASLPRVGKNETI